MELIIIISCTGDCQRGGEEDLMFIALRLDGHWPQVNWFWPRLPPVNLMTPKFLFFSKFLRPSESEITFASLGLYPSDTKTNILKTYWELLHSFSYFQKKYQAKALKAGDAIVKSGKGWLNPLPLPTNFAWGYCDPGFYWTKMVPEIKPIKLSPTMV